MAWHDGHGVPVPVASGTVPHGPLSVCNFDQSLSHRRVAWRGRGTVAPWPWHGMAKARKIRVGCARLSVLLRRGDRSR